MSKTPNPRSAAYSARSVSELAAALKQAEAQLALLGDKLDAATAARLRQRIAQAKHELGRLGRRGFTGAETEVPPFWRKFLDP